MAAVLLTLRARAEPVFAPAVAWLLRHRELGAIACATLGLLLLAAGGGLL